VWRVWVWCGVGVGCGIIISLVGSSLVLIDVAAPQRGDQVKQVFYKKKTWLRQ